MHTALKIRFRALLPMQGEPMENGELLIEQGRVREISWDGKEFPGIECLDLSDCLILPGFVNAHCHLSLSALKGKVAKHPRFTGWVRSLLAQNQEVSWTERVRALHAGAGDLLRSGVTTLGDYLSQPELLTEYSRLPFRQVLFLETLGFQETAVRETLDRVRSILESQNPQGGMIQLGLGPHAPYSVSPKLFRELKNLARRHGCPWSCHVAEFPEEVRFLKEGGGELEEFLRERGVYDAGWTPPGLSPARYLDKTGVLESLLAVHLNHIEGDLDLLASRRVKAVFCPESTRWFGRDRWMPVRDLLDRGMAVGLGTDSLASNDALNFLRELRAAETMLPDVTRGEILEIATAGGAAALGLPTGRIVPGAPADLIGFRIGTKPESWADIPFEADRQEVDFVMAGGQKIF